MRFVYDTYSSPLGKIYIIMNDSGIKAAAINEEQWNACISRYGDIKQDTDFCQEAIKELEEYFQGKRRCFSIPLSPEGTEFNKKVWNALLSIPHGKLSTYGEIAACIGSPKSYRAVGTANRNNPIPIFIPCHRVVSKTGNLLGYFGKSLGIKEYLLKLENAYGNL